MSPALRFLSSHQWAIEDATFDKLVSILERHAAGEKLDAEAMSAAIGRDQNAVDAREPVMQIDGDTAIVPMRGVLARYADSVNGICQARGRSAESVQQDLIDAAETGVNRIILRMDSPGGEVSGTAETAELIRKLSARGIQMIAFIDGMAGSAAYWIASQADEIVASSPAAIVGSIGVKMAVVERIPDEKREKVHVITSAPAKSAPQMNEAQLGNLKALVQDMASAFASAVAAGRGLDDKEIAKVATGEVWTAQTAKGLGLIDRIASFESLKNQRTTPTGTMVVPSPKAAEAAITPADETAAANGDHMKITAQALAALVAAFPIYSAFISERALAGDEEGAIRTALAGKQKAEADAMISDLKAKVESLTQAQATHAAALKAKDDEIVALKAQVEKTKAWKANIETAKDPGSDANVGDATNPLAEANLAAAWAKDPLVREAFGNDFGALKALAAQAPAEARKALGV